SKRNEVTNYKYPDIDPQVMGTISELLDVPFTISSMIEQIKSLLQTNYIITDDQLLLEEKQLFYKRVKQMHKRNEQLR
ncbi:MAG TPA: octanoyltransferase, partial [Pseudogracilibacillus sp.]|nr:octanoyltransferase [Pseudogracilibacillus sp.]